MMIINLLLLLLCKHISADWSGWWCRMKSSSSWLVVSQLLLLLWHHHHWLLLLMLLRRHVVKSTQWVICRMIAYATVPWLLLLLMMMMLMKMRHVVVMGDFMVYLCVKNVEFSVNNTMCLSWFSNRFKLSILRKYSKASHSVVCLLGVLTPLPEDSRSHSHI